MSCTAEAYLFFCSVWARVLAHGEPVPSCKVVQAIHKEDIVVSDRMLAFFFQANNTAILCLIGCTLYLFHFSCRFMFALKLRANIGVSQQDFLVSSRKFCCFALSCISGCQDGEQKISSLSSLDFPSLVLFVSNFDVNCRDLLRALEMEKRREDSARPLLDESLELRGILSADSRGKRWWREWWSFLIVVTLLLYIAGGITITCLQKSRMNALPYSKSLFKN